MKNVQPLNRLVEQFLHMPGVGRKSAQRMAFHVLSMSDEEIKNLTESIIEAHEKIHHCSICCDLTDQEICKICSDESRDKGIICVVENSKDVIAFERTREYKGVYHILHGVISPLNGVGPEDISIKELVSRMNDTEIKEVIMATNPTAEGEATAIFISRLLKPLGIKVSRLAYGIPVGADLEYADEFTLLKAIEGRKTL